MSATWKKLLLQAFAQTDVPTNSRGRSGLLQVYRFIYRSLQHAGIENRSPFNLLQIIHLRLQAKGDPLRVKVLCADALHSMQKPSFGFSPATGLLFSLTAVIMLSMLVSPRTANTYRTPIRGDTLLQYQIQPLPDLDALTVRLPISSDYQLDSYSPLADIGYRSKQQNLSGEEWIQQQVDSAYALQLLSASDPTNLEAFCQQHKICAKSAFYRTSIKGKTLYRLLYGVYPNHKAAKTARLQLSATLQKQSPWARQFRQIKQEIRSN